MKPDLTDFQASTKIDAEQGSRLVSWIVLALALSGFIALAWYAYQSGAESAIQQEIPTIEANESPIKIKPEEAGGEEFPHQDKTIYDVIANDVDIERVEKLMPEPEEPVLPSIKQVIADQQSRKEAKAPKAPKANTWVNEKLLQDEATDEPVPVEPVEDRPATGATAIVPEKPPLAADSEVAAREKKSSKPAVEVKPSKPATETPQARAGMHKLQLGAFGSKDEAEANWIRIRGQNSAILSGSSHHVVRADLPKGTFYRLRASGFASKAEAEAACKKLSANGQGCFYAGK